MFKRRFCYRMIGLIPGLLTLPIALAAEEYQRGEIVFRSNDGSYSVLLDARAQFDMGAVDSKTNPDFVADNDIRRARLAFKLNYSNTWAGEFDVDLSDDEVDLKDLWIAYTGVENWHVKLGNHKPHFSIAEVTTSRWYTFLEVPAVVEALGTGRKMGLSVNHWQDHYFIGAGVIGDEVKIDGKDDEGTSERFGFAARATISPFRSMHRAGQHLHFGASHINYTPESDDEDKLDYDVRPENRIVNYKMLDTGKLKRVDRIHTYSFETLYFHRKWIVQGEWLNTRVTFQDDQADYKADGFYLQGSYFIWGNGRQYMPESAELGPINIKKNEMGLEVAARFSRLDLNHPESDVLGGKGDFITLGLNWYPTHQLAFRLNLISARYDEYADGDGDFVGNDRINTLGLRVQYAF